MAGEVVRGDVVARRRPRWVLATVAVAAVLATGGATVSAYPALRERRDASDLEPGLLQVMPAARGTVALGDGVQVVLGSGGLTVSRGDAVVWRGVDRGSPFTAGLGHVEWQGGADALRAREVVDRVLGNLRVTGRRQRANVVTYTGRVFDGDPSGSAARDLTFTLTRRTSDSRVLLDLSAPGVDVLAMHEFRRPGFTYRGMGQQLAPPSASGRRPVVARAPGGGDATPAPMPFTLSSDLSGVGLDTAAYAVLDLSHGGRVDASVWSPRLRARLYDADTARRLVAQHTADVGRMPAAPGWTASGAVVGVGGGSARVRRAVAALRGARAAVAAVLVHDSDDRRAYPDWAVLVRELRAEGIRTLTTASPRLGPGDPPYAEARGRGWLLPTGLVDLSDPRAASWYAGVLAGQVRRDGTSGWLAVGGADLPMDARLAHGTPASEHNAWPTRWAQLTDAACRAVGPDCLALHESADEHTAPWISGFSTARPLADWGADGLGGVLPARLSAGLSGLTQVHSGVGGWRSPSVPLLGVRERSDELLARWTELETFGPLLRTEGGADPASMPQVWDSPARLRSFARATRLFAATATYRRQAVATAAATGVPVARPFWLEDATTRQGGAGEEYFFGASLLVVPVLRQGAREVRAVLPPGRWVEMFSGRRYDGPPALRLRRPARSAEHPPPPPVTARVPAPLGQPVVLYREGDPVGQALREVLRGAGLLQG